jgi:hypothetical protein
MGDEGEHVGVTALCGMAFISAGYVPGRGKYGRVLNKAVDFVLSCSRPEDGYITHQGSRMYSHGFATLFLSEIYGMTKRRDVKRVLRRAVDLIINSQNSDGGWRYQPMPVDSDISVTVSILQALRSARNAGISVPRKVIDKAVRYIERCATPRGFKYQAIEYTRTSYALTACGVVSLFSAGMYNHKGVQWGLRFLLNPPAGERLVWGTFFYFYGHYYAAQAMYMAKGKYWDLYYPKVRDEILKHQDKNGGWIDDVGETFATAMAIIVLNMPCEYLPIFQKTD